MTKPIISRGLIVVAMLVTSAAHAQPEEAGPAPAPDEFVATSPPSPEKPSIFPDLPNSLAEQTQVRSPWFTVRLGFGVLVDYSAFHEDSENVSQVGKQDDQWQVRDLRLVLLGAIGSDYKVDYFFSGVYKGFEKDPEKTWDSFDHWLAFPLGSPATKLTVGKMKEAFVYEMLGDAAYLPQQERVLNPFFVSRNVGVKLSHIIANQRMTMSAGVFNDNWVKGKSLEDGGTDVTMRFTGLAWDQPQRKRLLHLALSGRYVDAYKNTLRYKGRPESNVTDYYVDTGDLPSDHAWHVGLEALWNRGPFSVLAEYNRAYVTSSESGNPEFSGYYITGSWILAGETRPYDRMAGYARRVMSGGRWGALELVARFSHLDLDDGAVQGGKFDKTYLGINWWATNRWKLGAGWGHTWLDRFGSTGNMDAFLFRSQWIY